MLLVNEIKAIYSRRQLLSQMVSREIKARYKQSILGYFWVILNPLFQMLVMSFAFSVIMRIPTYANSDIPYSIFLYTALLPWTLFANSLTSASNSLVNNASLITKIYFPRTILPLATIIAKIVDFLFASTVLIAFFIIYKIPININIIWFFPIFFIQQILTMALALFFSASNLIYRDIQYLLSLILSLWMYLTPIVYPLDIVPAKLRFIFQLNPFSVLVNAYRQTILGQQSPNLTSLTIAFFSSFFLLLLGLKFFKQQEKTFADNI